MSPSIPVWNLFFFVSSIFLHRSSLVSSSPLDLNSVLKKGDTSVLKCAIDQDCSRAQYAIKPQGTDQDEPDLSDWNSLGLRSSNLHANQIAVGFAPGFRESKAPNTPAQINEHLPKPMAIVGDYYQLSWGDLGMKNLDYHLQAIKKLDGNPVWSIALMPSDGLDMITPNVANKVAQRMKEINDQGVTVWLRFGHEMNGDWNVWGMKPKKFVEKWKVLAHAVKSTAPSTYMLWSPNVMFGHSVDDLHGGYTPYWPGAESVDIAGISFYHWGDKAKRVNIAPSPEEAVQKLHDFSKIYGPEGWNKPIVIAETAASYTFNQDTNVPVEGGASDLKIKLTWLHLLLDRYIKATVPGLRAMVWFEVIKDENATGNTAVRTEDFRLITGNPRTRDAAHAFFRNLLKS